MYLSHGNISPFLPHNERYEEDESERAQISMTLAYTFIKTLAVDPYRFRNYTPSPFLIYEIWHSEAKKMKKIHNYTISFDTEKLKNLQWVEIIKPFY